MLRRWPSIALSPRALTLAGTLGVAVASAGPLGCDRVPPAPPGSSGAPAARATEDAVLWPGKPVGELYRVGEVREFTFVQDGTQIGTSWGRYDGPFERDGEQLHRFSTRIELRVPDSAGASGGGARQPPARSEGEIIVDAQGNLVEGFERSDAVVLTFKVADGLLELEAAGERDQIKHEPGDAYMAFMATLHEELMFGLRQIGGDATLAWRISTLSGGLPAEWTGEVVGNEDGVIALSTSLGEVVELSGGRIRRIEVPDDALVVTAKDSDEAKWPTWSIEGPRELHYQLPADATWTVREVELPARQGEPNIAGEVLVPKDASEQKPRPAVLFLAAAGLTDRYGFAGPPPVDLGSHTITDALAREGYVVLRYDEPGHGESDDAVLSWDRQLEDARRGLRMLMVQPEVDPDRILVVGHGEGGWRGLVLAVERPREVAGVALLAAPGRPYRKILKEQAEATIARLDPGVREEARQQHRELIAAIASGQGVPPEFAAQAQWLREIMDFDPAAWIKRLAQTQLWIAQGSKDFEVNVESDPLALDRAARRAKKPAKLSRYPDLDHLFKFERETVSRPAHYRDERAVDRRFLQDLVDWADGVTRKR